VTTEPHPRLLGSADCLQRRVRVSYETLDRWAQERRALEAERDRLREALVMVYREAPLPVAHVCDEFLDCSGRLLGEIRQEAIRAAA
jgi:hypothetical protein